MNREMDNPSRCKITGIAELHKYCAKHKLEFPCYKIIETTDFSNCKQFTAHCSVRNITEVASGTNKKQAKHKAAYVLLERLKHRAVIGCKDLFNDNSEDSLEEGEIDDREEGEIYDIGVDDKKGKIDDNDDEDDDILDSKYRQYRLKKVYMEGNVKDNNINLVKNVQNKSQVQLLAEFCFEHKLPSPRYEISEHLGINAPIFKCQCSVLQLIMSASGLKKRDVKEKASLFLLTKMKKHIHILTCSTEKDKKVPYELEEGEIVDEDFNDQELYKNNHKLVHVKKKMRRDNGINLKPKSIIIRTDTGMSELYKYCLKLKLPPPVYTMLDRKDVSVNKKVFTFQCSVLKFSKIGYGLNKRQAKHKAARLVLEKLQNWDHKEKHDNEEDLLEEGEITEKDEVVKQEFIKRKVESNFITREEKHLQQMGLIAESHNSVEKNKPYTDSKTIKLLPKLNELQIAKHAGLLLEQVCKEIEVTYDFVDFKSASNKVSSLYLNSIPPWSTFGEGNVYRDARHNATKKMLSFLKSMSQRNSL